mmetsp:Transcript_25183/g.72714  ORF Transcript_25183/g.72714 Transcript_25183/m.72714 type:complete len:238 (-) Transcript_25183:593-1306(-)
MRSRRQVCIPTCRASWGRCWACRMTTRSSLKTASPSTYNSKSRVMSTMRLRSTARITTSEMSPRVCLCHMRRRPTNGGCSRAVAGASCPSPSTTSSEGNGAASATSGGRCARSASSSQAGNTRNPHDRRPRRLKPHERHRPTPLSRQPSRPLSKERLMCWAWCRGQGQQTRPEAAAHPGRWRACHCGSKGRRSPTSGAALGGRSACFPCSWPTARRCACLSTTRGHSPSLATRGETT